MGCEASRCNKTSTLWGIFIVIPELEGGQTRLKRHVFSPWGKTSPAGHQCRVSMSSGKRTTILQNTLQLSMIRPIIVNFSFIVISCTQSLMRHEVIIWLFGKIFENSVFSSLSFFMCFYMCFVYTSIDFKTI